ncbi:MAG: SDR family NAD(P)-dependent oxidoreductase, partial [bacterium]
MSSTRSILITGGGSAIGLELARLLASREHSLILVGRDAARLQAAANELRLTHGT